MIPVVDRTKRTKSDKSRHRKAERRARLRAARTASPSGYGSPTVVRSPDRPIIGIEVDPIGPLDYRREVLPPRRSYAGPPKRRPEYLGWGIVTVGGVGILAHLASKLGERRRR